MQLLRALIRDHRHFALALLVMAFCIKAAIPSGFMVSASPDAVLTVRICSDETDGLKTMQMVIPSKERSSDHHEGKKKGEHCALSGLARSLRVALMHSCLRWLLPSSFCSALRRCTACRSGSFPASARHCAGHRQ